MRVLPWGDGPPPRRRAGGPECLKPAPWRGLWHVSFWQRAQRGARSWARRPREGVTGGPSSWPALFLVHDGHAGAVPRARTEGGDDQVRGYLRLYRGGAADEGAVAEFPVSTLAPGQHLALAGQRQAVAVARAQRGHTGHVGERGDVPLGEAAVAELPEGVIAPGQYVAGVGAGEEVEAAADGADHLDPGGYLGEDRGGGVGEREIVAQLAERIVAPGQDLALGGHRQAVAEGRGQARQRDTAEGDQHRGVGVGEGPVAKLPELVAPPGEDRGAVAGQGQVVVLAGGNRLHLDTLWHVDEHRDVAVGVEAVAKLAEEVITPREHPACAGQGEGVKAAGPDLGDLGAGRQTDLDRDGATAADGPVTELPEAVIAPGEHRSGAGERHREAAALPDLGDLCAGRQLDLDRHI